MASGFKKFAKQTTAAPAVASTDPMVIAPPSAAASAQPTLKQLQAQLAESQAKLNAQLGKPAPAVEAVPVAAVPAPFPGTPAAVIPAQQAANALALFAGNPTSALSAFIATADASAQGAALKFPVVQLGGGPSGGSFAAADWVKKSFGQECADILPSGKKPIEGVYLGYRLEITAWPNDFNDRQADSKPSYSVAVSANDPNLMQLATKACKNYQYTKAADKKQFDSSSIGAPGHIRPNVQLLVFLPDIGLVVVQTAANYNGTERTLKNLARNVDSATGALNPFPAHISPVTLEDGAGAKTWKTHHLEFTVANTTEGKKAWDQFNDWRANILPTDPETVQNVRDFLGAQDRPATPAITQSLTTAANI